MELGAEGGVRHTRGLFNKSTTCRIMIRSAKEAARWREWVVVNITRTVDISPQTEFISHIVHALLIQYLNALKCSPGNLYNSDEKKKYI